MTTGKEPEGKRSRLESLEDTVIDLIDVVKKQSDSMEQLSKDFQALQKTTVKKSTGLFGGKRDRKAQKDTKTDKIYPSKASVGKALYEEVDTEPDDHFAWYKLQSKFPDRFVDASEEEAKKAWKEEEERIAKVVEEANKRLQAEAAKAEQAGKK